MNSIKVGRRRGGGERGKGHLCACSVTLRLPMQVKGKTAVPPLTLFGGFFDKTTMPKKTVCAVRLERDRETAVEDEAVAPPLMA